MSDCWIGLLLVQNVSHYKLIYKIVLKPITVARFSSNLSVK